jgi:hypothetical protein
MNSETSANPDHEILDAVRPGLATTGGPLFLISSPYARRGVLWEVYNKHYGPAGDPLILVAQAPSRTMNPTLKQSVVDRAMERDPASARAEYLAEFRTDIESFVALEVVRACVTSGVYERPPQREFYYQGFVDPSGGSADSFSLAIAHYDHSRNTVVLDAIRETLPPFSPESVVEQFAALCKSYNVHTVQGDKFAGIWPVELFAKSAITYQQSARPKSELYGALLPLLNSARIELLDHAKLTNQLLGLERRTARGGKDSIDHGPGSHDDICNAVAGVAYTIHEHGGYITDWNRWISGDEYADANLRTSREWRYRTLAAALHSMVF